MPRRTPHGSLAVRVGLLACAGVVALAAAPAADDAPTPAAPAAPQEHPADAIDRKALKARETWWSWKPLAAPQPPQVRDAAWCRSPLDRFVLAKLESKGIAPAPEADRVALIRRATFDLTGLPPTPQEVADFVADAQPDAYERVLDRLLASPRYGEKWGRFWLDLVRYADTNGFERDGDKPAAWRYRDWVVQALNDDKPYDRFVQEQLAGDELPDRDFGTLVATGYYRLGMWDDEVPDLAQAQADDMDGIVDVTARTFLGVAMGCVRCHDHKGDPIAHRDYYRFAAFFAGVKPYKTSPFNSIAAENVMRSARTDFGRADPETERRAFREERAGLLRDLHAIEREAGLEPAGEGDAVVDRAPAEGLVTHLAFEDAKTGTAANGATAPDGTSAAGAKVRDAGFGAPGRFGKAFGFDGGDDRVEFDRPVQDDFTVGFWFRTTDIGGGSDTDTRWFLGKGLVDGEVPGIVDDWGISLVGHGVVAAGTGAPETFVASGPGHNDGAWHHVAFTRTRKTGDIALWVDGMRVATATGSRRALVTPKKIAVGSLQNDIHPFAGTIDEVRIWKRPLADDEIRAMATGLAPAAAAGAAVESRLPARAAEWRTKRDRLAAMTPPDDKGESLLVVREEADPRETRVFTRGSPHAPAEAVEPGVPTIAAWFVPDPPAARPHGESSGRRLALARWITDPRNGLTLRTLANRLWQQHFAQGLCPTPNDLGKLGEPAVNPELLDWLACQVPTNGWSLKKMHRLLMTSSAYRMSSVAGPDALAKDAPNDLLSRQRMRRLTAEELRDGMLACAGTLSTEAGGPGMRPPMPAEVLATSSRPEEVWPLTPKETWTRRSLYIHLKRSLQHPLLSVFDLADVDGMCPVRFQTVQPTQALSMLNGALTNDLAADLADRLARERPGDLRAQLQLGRVLTSGRAPTREELDEADAFIHELRMKDGMDERQALASYCLVLFNLNEFLAID